MSVVDTYKNEFKIFLFDEDISRSDKIADFLKQKEFQITAFNSRGLFSEILKKDLPHVVIMFYQPLNMKFRELLKKVRESSSEIEVVLLGSNEFWPGVSSLIQAGLVNDFWSYPLAGQGQLELRIERIIEKNIYKFIAEQRSEATEKIVQRLDELADSPRIIAAGSSDTDDVSRLLSASHRTEATLIEELVARLKSQFPESEFVYFKNYRAKDQLLVTRTSFSSENYFRGQAIPFHQEGMQLDRNDALNKLRDVIEETFSCDSFIMQPVEFAEQFYGLIMAVNFEDNQFLQKTARYLSVSLRNYLLESSTQRPDPASEFDVGISKGQFPYSVSTEVSRARRLKLPVAVVVAQIEYVGDSDDDFQKAFSLIQNNLRNYDFVSQIDKNQIGIVLPHCRYEDAAIKAETLRRQLVARGLKSQNTPLRLCFGVSEYPSLSPDSDSLIADAKKACSQVLVSGKNKVCLYSKPANHEPEFSLQP